MSNPNRNKNKEEIRRSIIFPQDKCAIGATFSIRDYLECFCSSSSSSSENIREVFSDQVTSCTVSETNNVASGKRKREAAILMKSTATLMKLTHKNNRSNRSPRSENKKRQQSRTPLDPKTQVLSLQNMGYNSYNP